MKDTDRIYGIRAVMEAINANEPIDKIFIQKGLKSELSRELETLMRKKKYKRLLCADRKIEPHHQG